MNETTKSLINDLNDAEYALEILHDITRNPNNHSDLSAQFRNSYELIKALRDCAASNHNEDPEQAEKVYRCTDAEEPDYADCNLQCDVWGVHRTCDFHVQMVEDMRIRNEKMREEAKNRKAVDYEREYTMEELRVMVNAKDEGTPL